MTKAQRRDYKIGNQLRRDRIIWLGKNAPERERGYWVRVIGVMQKGKAA